MAVRNSRSFSTAPDRKRFLPVLAGIAASSLATPHAQAQFSIVPTLATTLEAYDNRRVRPTDGSGLGSSILEIGSTFRYRAPTYEVGLAPEFHLTRNTSDKVLDAEEYFVALNGQKSYERHRFSLNFNFARELSTRLELVELGRIDSATPRTTIGFSSAWNFFVSDRFSTTAFGGISDTSFEDAGQSALLGYRYSNAGLNFRYVFSDRTALLWNNSVAVFDTPDLSSETTSFSFQFGFEHQFTETLYGELLVGQNHGRSRFRSTSPVVISIVPLVIANQRITQEDRSSGRVINAQVVKDLERLRFAVEWNRAISPSSLGSRQITQSVLGKGDYDINERWSSRVVLRFEEREQEITTGGVLRPLKIARANAELVYEYDRNTSLSFGYRFVYQERPDAGESATSNRIALEVRFVGDPIPYFR